MSLTSEMLKRNRRHDTDRSPQRSKIIPRALVFLILCNGTSVAGGIVQHESGLEDKSTADTSETAMPEPLDLRLHRLWLKYESEFAFLLPEGEFNAALEKKSGYFRSQAWAHYNFVSGDLGFWLRNLYTRFRLVPYLQVYDRLTFVPLYSPDRTWRREQGMQLGGGFTLRSNMSMSINLNFQRFSFPSNVDYQTLESRNIRSISQTLGAWADSVEAAGFYHSGLFELELARAFRIGDGGASFLQLRFNSRGQSEGPWLTLAGQVQLVSLLSGFGVPRIFWGGRGKLSGYRVNEFSGTDLLYLSQLTRFRLNRKPLSLISNFTAHELSLATHLEAGQVGNNRRIRDAASYHTSVGIGLESMTAYRQLRAFELFFWVYKALEHDRDFRYYIGVRY